MATRVKLGDAEYTYRLDLGAIMAYERLAQKVGEGNLTPSVQGVLTHYTCLLADEAFTMTLDEFVACVATQAELVALNEALVREQARWRGLNDAVAEPAEESGEVKKK